MKLIRKFRLCNKIWANLFGYFWLPCPICGNYFGGHEWLLSHCIMIGNKGNGVCYRKSCKKKAQEMSTKGNRIQKYCDKIEPVYTEIDKKYVGPLIINILTFYVGLIALYLAIFHI